MEKSVAYGKEGRTTSVACRGGRKYCIACRNREELKVLHAVKEERTVACRERKETRKVACIVT